MNDADDDPFSLLGLPRRFSTAPGAVHSAHLRRLARLHPDRIADPVARLEGGRDAARLNAARDVLLDDERRADLLLRLLGGPSKEEDRSLPDGFLMEMMETRERIDALLADGDPAQRDEIETWATAQRRLYVERVGALLDQATSVDGPASTEVLAAVRLELNAWRYIERLLEQLPAPGEPPSDVAPSA